MKYLYSFLFLTVMCTANAQDAPKHAAEIIVKNVSFAQVIQSLADSSYFIDKKDNDVQTVYTVKRPVDQTAARFFGKNAPRLTDVVFFIRVKDSVAHITGKFSVDIDAANRDEVPIANKGAKRSYWQIAWQAMDKFAKSLKGEISYSKN